MTKATQRLTAGQRQMAEARKARRQAALDRRQDDYRQDAGYQAIYAK